MSFLRKSGIFLSLLGAILCWVIGFGNLRYLPKEALVSYHAISPLGEERYESMLLDEEKNPIPRAFALWTQRDGVAISAGETGRPAQVSVIELRGDSRLLFPQSAVLAAGDEQGCLIDQKTALALFGHKKAEGASILLGEKTYEIRGALSSPSATMVLAGGKESKYNQITVQSPQKEGDSFAFRHGVTWQLKTESTMHQQLADSFVRLPLLFLLGLGACLCIALRGKRKDILLPHTLLSIGAWVLGTGFLLLLIYTIPSGFLPSRWSDFSAWRQTFSTAQSYLASYLGQPRLRPELGSYGMIAGSAWALLSIPLLVAAWELYRGGVPKQS